MERLFAMTMISTLVRGEGIFARAMRSSVWTAFGYAASQIVRLGSNLILTRLLFPETFGMMALITVAMTGLQMFSDVGIGPSIMQNQRGDDPAFLNTAWTLQVVRGLMLWLGSCALAVPIAQFYGEPMLAQLLPVAGLAMLIGGFNPTRIDTAGRHLMLGRLTILDLLSQITGIIAMVLLAFATRSVWALVIGGITGAVAKLILTNIFLEGPANRFQWEKAAAHDLVHFGKWIFLSTFCGFVIAQGDRVILGKYLTLEMLGIYNIGYFLASFPLLLGGAIVGRILIPLYRERPPAASLDNFLKLRRMRFPLTGLLMSAVLTMAFLGVVFVGVLYDARYVLAGPIVVVAACAQIPQIICMTYDQAALAAGDSRRFFFLLATKAAVLIAAFMIGVEQAGLIGALVGQGVATMLIYPCVVILARRYRAWDALHDATYAVIGMIFGGMALWLNWDSVMMLAGTASG